MAARLPAWALFSALVATAGLPIYIHAPKVYVDDYGVSLAALGLVLFGLRLVDVVQDPALGWLSAHTRAHRGAMVAGAAGVMVLAMLMLFAVPPPVAPLAWFALSLALLFSGFSFLTITFYAQGVTKADGLGPKGHLRLAGWRESGSLIGVSLAAVAPVALGLVLERPFAGFAAGFAVLALAAVLAMRDEWGGAAADLPDEGWRAVLRDGPARRLLLIALLNAAPVAITSTLFLFFVESRLGAPGAEGPLLLLFFLSAAASAPVWARLAQRFGPRAMLLVGMALAIVAFVFAYFLGPGDTLAFAVICMASGAAMGADLTLLPALFARRMAVVAPEAAAGFGLWAFVSKLALAFAAIVLFPILDRAGFRAGAENTQTALQMLSVLYALVPCALKLVAMALLATTPLVEETP